MLLLEYLVSFGGGPIAAPQVIVLLLFLEALRNYLSGEFQGLLDTSEAIFLRRVGTCTLLLVKTPKVQVRGSVAGAFTYGGVVSECKLGEVGPTSFGTSPD